MALSGDDSPGDNRHLSIYSLEGDAQGGCISVLYSNCYWKSLVDDGAGAEWLFGDVGEIVHSWLCYYWCAYLIVQVYEHVRTLIPSGSYQLESDDDVVMEWEGSVVPEG